MKQIIVVAEDRPNSLPEMLEVLAGAGVNLESIDSEVIGGSIVVIFTVDQYDHALQTLSRAGYHAVSEEAILVRLVDRPGALAEVAHRFHEAGVPIRGVRVVRRGEGFGIVAISTPRTAEAMALVETELIG